MTGPQGEARFERLCLAGGVSRASFYRGWAQAEPDLEEMALRDAIQRLALMHRHYGYRRIGALLRREGWCVNAKRVLRIMHEDNLLCLRKKAYAPATTDSNHGWRVYPDLARRMVPMAPDRLWVADITYIRSRAFRSSSSTTRPLPSSTSTLPAWGANARIATPSAQRCGPSTANGSPWRAAARASMSC